MVSGIERLHVEVISLELASSNNHLTLEMPPLHRIDSFIHRKSTQARTNAKKSKRGMEDGVDHKRM